MNLKQKKARRYIIDLLFYGISENGQNILLPIYGILTEYKFLKRIYNLEEINSIYQGYENLEKELLFGEELYNYEEWIFNDERLGLRECDDFENFLRLICECFNPFVRNENNNWRLFLSYINNALRDCEYEIFEEQKINGKEIFGFREIDKSLQSVKIKKGYKIKGRHNEYTVNAQFKQGGSARLFYVKDNDGKDYVIKVIDCGDETSKDKITRFENELNFLYTHKHNNIVEVIDYGMTTDNQYIYYVMPKYRCDLRNMINQGIEYKKIIKYFWQICEGIKCAHSLKCWHRDLKPENILYDCINDKLVVADFGIAHFSDDDKIRKIKTTEKDKLANYDYHAPEQRKGGSIIESPSADIWAIGLILNEMFTKKLAIGEGYTTISSVARSYGALDSVVSHMLQSQVEKRCQTIFEVQLLFCSAIGDRNKMYYAELMKGIFDFLVYPTTEQLESFVNNDIYRISFTQIITRYNEVGLDKEIYPFYIVFLNQVIKYIYATKSGFYEYYYIIKILMEIISDPKLIITQKPFIIYLCSEFNNIADSIGKYENSRSYGIGWKATDYIYNNYESIPKKNVESLLENAEKNGYMKFVELLKNLRESTKRR